MNKGTKIRFSIHNVLFNIYKKNITLEESFLIEKIEKYNEKDRSLINNVCLNSMRYYFHCIHIIKKYLIKKTKKHQEILLVSAITQIVFLGFKEYAVIDCSVNIAKKLNIYHGLVNAFLKNILRDKDILLKTTINFCELPLWFINETKDLDTADQKIFLQNFYRMPDLHLIFKNEKNFLDFEEDIEPTSFKSGFLKKRKKITEISSYKKGTWWVQDFSSALPLIDLPGEILAKKNIDLCCAPGGKSFQILSRSKIIKMNDKNNLRLDIVKENLKRLHFNPEILNSDALELDLSIKYDFIIIDAPCSSIGTVRKNPEILFKKNGPEFGKLLKLQQNLIKKASQLLNNNGIMLYMVCSFLLDFVVT